jgi:hypothetical protein
MRRIYSIGLCLGDSRLMIVSIFGEKNPEKNGGNTKKGEKRSEKGRKKGYGEQP